MVLGALMFAQSPAVTTVNWPLDNLDLSGGRFSPLDQINTSNAAALAPCWLSQTGVIDGVSNQTTPVIVDGSMFVTDPRGSVDALDAADRPRLWTFDVTELVGGGAKAGDILRNRGVCHADGISYTGAGSFLFALDAKTGKPIRTWGKDGQASVILDVIKERYPDVTSAITLGYRFTTAPQIHNGMICIGSTRSGSHIPGGHVLAVDAKTGKVGWHFNTIPQDGRDQGWDIASPAWVGGQRNGGGIWETPSIDAELGTIYVAVGNPFGESSKRIGTNVLTAGLFARPAALQQLPVPSRGAALFDSACASCHNPDEGRAPSREVLHGRSPQAIVDALTAGSMKYQGLALSGEERRLIAEYLTGRKLRAPLVGNAIGNCKVRPPLGDPAAGPLWNGWGPSIDNTHFQPASQAGLTADQVPQLHLKWAFGFLDSTSAWAQPTIASGRLYVGSQNGTVYSLDAVSGCVVWTFVAQGGVRASVSVGAVRSAGFSGLPSAQARDAAYFSDQKGFVYALDAATGKLIWTRKVEEHPLVRLTGSPALYRDRLYVPTSSYEEGGKPPGYACCTFRGSVVALDVKDGRVIWKSYTIAEEPRLLRAYADGTELRGPAGGAVWSSPTIDVKRGAIYVGVGNTYSGAAQPTTDAVLAFDLKTGALRWSRQMAPATPDVFGCMPGEQNCGARAGPDFDFGASPVIAKLSNGREFIVAGQKSGVVYALDPDKKGEPIWHYRAGGGSGLGGIQWGIAVDGERVYVPVAEIYNPKPGGLHAIDLVSGTGAWHAPPPDMLACGKPSRACSGAQFSAVTVIPGIVFSPSNDGAVRAFSVKDGRVVWTFDTNKEFLTINGLRAKGGSMNGPAPVVAGGMVYVSSGYGVFGLRPGNVLLAFGVD